VKWCECDACGKLVGVNFAEGVAGRMTRRQVDIINAVATAFLHQDRTTGTFNLELMGRQHELAAGGSAEVRHRYRVLAGADEIHRAFSGVELARPAPEPEEPLSRIPTMPGKVGEMPPPFLCQCELGL